MQLGYSITSHFGPEWAPADYADAVLDRAAVAAEAGFDAIEVGDHHGIGGDAAYLQNVPMGARLTQYFDRVAVMYLLPLHHPVVVAEQAGTIAALCDEFDFWCAVGGGQAQYDAIGVPIEERGRRFVEGLELIRRLWAGDDVDFEGEFWRASDLSIDPKADARFCLGGSAEVAVRRAGRRGDAWVANADTSPSFIEEARSWFEAEGGGDLIVRRDVLALEDGERAAALAHEKLEAGYRGWSPAADWILAGDADAVAADLAILEALGADEVVVRPMSDTHAEETLRTVATARDRL